MQMISLTLRRLTWSGTGLVLPICFAEQKSYMATITEGEWGPLLLKLTKAVPYRIPKRLSQKK